MSNPRTPPETDSVPRLSSNTRLGHVHLNVDNLDREVLFYTRVLGFTLHSQAGAEAALGTEAEVLLRLSEVPGARHAPDAAGMYHFAILYPSRKALARAIARLFAMRYPNAPTDHGISQTTYLDDLEGNNIELYVRTLDAAVYHIENGELAVRYADGRVGTGRDPLDLESLFSELDENEPLDLPLPAGTQIGHVHLYASGMDATMDFYANVLGFEAGPIMRSFRMGEVGLDEQQPHVVAFNTWKGEGIPPAPVDALGMRHFTVVLPDESELRQVVARVRGAGLPTEETAHGTLVRDPSNIAVILTDTMLPVA